MNVKNKRSLIAAVISTILLIACFIIYMVYEETRFAASGVLLLILSIVNFIRAFSKKGILEEAAEHNDERDLYLISKTSHITIKTLIYMLCGFTFLSLLLYSINKSEAFIIIACTLCATLVLLFIIYLCTNIYLEKHE